MTVLGSMIPMTWSKARHIKAIMLKDWEPNNAADWKGTHSVCQPNESVDLISALQQFWGPKHIGRVMAGSKATLFTRAKGGGAWPACKICESLYHIFMFQLLLLVPLKSYACDTPCILRKSWLLHFDCSTPFWFIDLQILPAAVINMSTWCLHKIWVVGSAGWQIVELTSFPQVQLRL